ASPARCHERPAHTPFAPTTLRPPRAPTLFPYTTLFRSSTAGAASRDRTRGPAARRWQPAQLRCGHYGFRRARSDRAPVDPAPCRSEEHTSELQSRGHLVFRLLPGKKKPVDNLRG